MFKKSISVLLTVVMLLTLLSVGTVSAGADDTPLFEYELVQDGTVWITAHGPILSEDLIIPTTIDGYTVSGIGPGAFMSCDFTFVYIPENIKYIDMMAFYDCEQLELLYLSEGLSYIGEYAFENCFALDSVIVPKSVRYLGEYAFGYVAIDNGDGTYTDSLMNDFTMYVIKGSAAETYAQNYNVDYNYPIKATDDFYYTTLMDDTIIVLKGKSGITDFVIPAEIDGVAVTAINNEAFMLNNSIRSIVIPPSVTVIGSMAFYGCVNLTSVTLKEGLEAIYSYAFEDCFSLESLTIPKSVNEIGNFAFNSYDELVTDEQSNQSWQDYYDRLSGFTARVYKGSAAEEFAKQHEIAYTYARVYGDMDGSGVTDIVDATLIQRKDTGIQIPCGEADIKFGDVDGNGNTNVVDATFIQRYATRLKTPWPMGEPIET